MIKNSIIVEYYYHIPKLLCLGKCAMLKLHGINGVW
jgi:hypothetical protein